MSSLRGLRGGAKARAGSAASINSRSLPAAAVSAARTAAGPHVSARAPVAARARKARRVIADACLVESRLRAGHLRRALSIAELHCAPRGAEVKPRESRSLSRISWVLPLREPPWASMGCARPPAQQAPSVGRRRKAPNTDCLRTLPRPGTGALVCPAGAWSIGVKGPRRGDDDNRSRTARSDPQGSRRERAEANLRPKEHEMGSEAGVRGRAGEHARSPRVIDGASVEPRRREADRIGTDPGRSRRLRGGGKSAEAIVAKEARRKPGRAKGRRTKEQSSMRT